MQKSLFILLVCLIALPGLKATDFVVLKDGHGFSGEIRSIKNCTVKLQWNNDKLYIPLEEVEYIEFDDPTEKAALDFMAMPEDNNCILGMKDAEMYHGKYGGHVVLGFLFGPFAMVGTAIAQPFPYRGKHTMALSKNRELFDNPDYALCYKRKAKGRLIGAEAIGWGSFILLIIAFGAY